MYNYQIRKNLYLKNVYIEMQDVYVNTFKKYDTDYRKFRHDIKNHLSTLNLLLISDKKEKAIEYLD